MNNITNFVVNMVGGLNAFNNLDKPVRLLLLWNR